MYSDGLTEAMDAAGEEYGPGRLASFSGGAGPGPRSVVKAIAPYVHRFHGSDGFGDDPTIMVARRLQAWE